MWAGLLKLLSQPDGLALTVTGPSTTASWLWDGGLKWSLDREAARLRSVYVE